MAAVFTPLGADEAIGVVALSGPADEERLDRGLAALRTLGRPVIEAANVRRRERYLAGTDEERLAGLNGLLNQGVRVFIAARGGYGLTRILERLPWARLVERRAVFIGFSDVTALINPLADRKGAIQVHGPVVTQLGDDGARELDRLAALIEGRLSGKSLFEIQPDNVVRAGRARGTIAAWNLSLLAALAGTPWQQPSGNLILCLEDVNEPHYRLDRLLTQVRVSGIVSGVKALISGNLSECSGGDGSDWRRLLLEMAPAGIPIVDGLPFGHGRPNLAFPVGVEAEIDTADGTFLWRT